MPRTTPALLVGLFVIQTACPPPAPQQYSAQATAGSQATPPPPPPPPPPQPQYAQQPAYGAPQGPGLVFGTPGAGYGQSPQGAWGSPQPGYGAAPQQPAWGAPQPGAYPQQPQPGAWGAPQPGYGQPQPQPGAWGAPQPGYGQPQQQPAWGAPQQPAPTAPTTAWGAPQQQPVAPQPVAQPQPFQPPVMQPPVAPQPVAQPQASSSSALVRVIHASPEPMARAVVAYLDNSTTPAIPSLEFRSAVGYQPIGAGAHVVQARLPGMPATTPPALSWNTPTFQAGHAYTVIAHGVMDFSGQSSVTFAPEEDSLTAPAPGRTNIRFFHAIVGGPAVDVCVGGTTPAFVAVNYGAWASAFGSSSRYAAASPGTITVALRAAGGGAPCGGRPLGTAQVTLPDRSNLTVIAVGRAGRGAPEVLLCTDAPLNAPSQCATIPVTGA